MNDHARAGAASRWAAGHGRLVRGAAVLALAACAPAACAPAAGEQSAAAREAAAEPPADPPTPGGAAAARVDQPRVERRAAGCRVLGPTDAHAALALAACGRARSEVARVLGAAVPPGLVVVAPPSEAHADPDTLRARGERWVVSVAMHEASEELQLGDGRRLSPSGYVTHEVVHRAATALLYPADTGAPVAGRYGSPLPDWLDEGLAMLAEPPGDQRARLGLLFDGETVYALPLRRFLYMTHPAFAGVAPGSQLRRTFYGQSLAFTLFVQDRAGAAGIRALVDTLRRGTTQGAALTGLAGMPADGGALEQAWLAWLRANRGALTARAPAGP